MERLYKSNEERTSVENGLAPSGDCSAIFTLELTETLLAGSDAPEQTRRCRFVVVELPSADPLSQDPSDIRAQEGPEKHRGILALGHLLQQLSGTTGEVAWANYGQSTLTRLLEDVLGGNAVTHCLATLSNEGPQSRAVSGATVRHLRMLQQVRNFPIVVDDSLGALLRRHRLKVAQLAEEVAALKSGDGGRTGGGSGKERMAQHLLAIHELEGRVIAANMEKVRLGEEREKLLTQFKELRGKYTSLAEAKAELQQQVITSEEGRLKIAQALIDLQIDKTQSAEVTEQQKFELSSKVIAAQNEVVELEMRQKSEAGKITDLGSQIKSLLEEKQQIATEFVALKTNLLNSRKETELQRRKGEELSIELLNLVNAREALAQEKDAQALQHAEQLAMQDGDGKISDETRAVMQTLQEGSKELHEANAKLRFAMQQKDVELSQLQLQLEKALLSKAVEAQGQADSAEHTMSKLHDDVVRLEGELKREQRAGKEQEADMQREREQLAELITELGQARERLKAADRRFREQVKEHMDDLARLTSAATPRVEQLNTETRKLIDQMAMEIQSSYAVREQTLLADLARSRERLARAVRKNKLLFKGYRTLRHRIEDSASFRDPQPDIRKEDELEEGELEEEGSVMEAELMVMRQRVDGLEEDLDRQRQKAITVRLAIMPRQDIGSTPALAHIKVAHIYPRLINHTHDLDCKVRLQATEAYQKMVVDLQHRHAGTVVELENALKEVDKLSGYRDLHGKLQQAGELEGGAELANVMRENMALQSQLGDLRNELETAWLQRQSPDSNGGPGPPATAQLQEMSILRQENARLSAMLQDARGDLATEVGGGMASARAQAEGRESFHKGLKEFSTNTQVCNIQQPSPSHWIRERTQMFPVPRR
jgi:hypothetical protein